jgi:tetratricopeptide (TPR) repeat protein
MIRKTLLTALLLPLALAVPATARDLTAEKAHAAQEAEWRKNQEAIEEETKAIRQKSEEAKTCVRTVWSAASQGDLPKAIAAFRKLDVILAGLKTAYLHRARCYDETTYGITAKWDKIIADCTQVIRLDPQEASAYSMRGLSYSYKNEYGQALADCNRAIALDPKCAEAYVNRGDVWTQKGEFEKALADCNQGILLHPKFARGYLVRGIVWSDKGERDKALADWEKGLSLTPDDWRLINDIGVGLWQKAQEQDWLAAKAEAAGDLEAAKASRRKSAGLKNDAKAKWKRGIIIRPTAPDIHSNLGFAYSDANDLDSAERHLRLAVKFSSTSPRAHNNLGRVLLRRSQRLEAEASQAEAKAKTDFFEVDRVQPLRDEATMYLKDAITEFDEAVTLDPTLPEARLNLGEVYLAHHDLAKAEVHYAALVKLQSDRAKDRETSSIFSQAHHGLARIAVARQDRDQAVRELRKALELNPQNSAAVQVLATTRFQQGEYREGEKCLASLLAMLPAAGRREAAKQFGKQFEDTGKTNEAVRAGTFLGWTFATSPEPRMRDANTALELSQHVVELTKGQDPLALDTLAAAQAASGSYDDAVKTAQAGLKLANSQGNTRLAEAIARRVALYQKKSPYRSDSSGSDRP